MKRFFQALYVVVLLVLVGACTRGKDDGGLCKASPVMVLRVPTGVYPDGDQLRVAVMLSHQFYTIEAKAENKESIDLIRQAIESETLLTFLVRDDTREIVAVGKASDEDASRFKSVFSQARNGLGSLKLSSVVPDLATLNELFVKVQNASCSFPVKKPCIPFDYPVDGCYARAHKVRQLLNASGYECKKEFVYGDLRARYGSSNPQKGGCCLSWSYHVAALVTYKDEKGMLQECIIDPSLFKTPVPDAEWRKACANTSCGSASISSFTTTAGNVYYRSPKGTFLYDDAYVHTDCVLNIFADVSGCSTPTPSTASCDF